MNSLLALVRGWGFLRLPVYNLMKVYLTVSKKMQQNFLIYSIRNCLVSSFRVVKIENFKNLNKGRLQLQGKTIT